METSLHFVVEETDMRAVVVSEPGAKPAPTDVPTPQPGAGEVLVRVQASSVNGFDLSVAAGHVVGMMEHRYPLVLGKDFAGTVEAVGDAVTRFAVGDTVFGVVTKPYLGDGGVGGDATGPGQIGLTTPPPAAAAAAARAPPLAGTPPPAPPPP